MNSVTLIISISVIILLLYVIFSILRRKTYTGSIQDPGTTINVPITANTTAAAAYSIWIYGVGLSGGSNIFTRGTSGTNGIKVSFANNTNKLNVTLYGSTATNASFTKYPGYIYPSNSTYYYATDTTCQINCDMRGSTCTGYNYYNSYTPTDGNTSLQTSYLSTQGCQFLNANNLQNGFTGSTGYIKIKTPESSTTLINTFIPLEEWVFITINMDTNYTEVYINGKLVQTIINTNVTHTGTTATLGPTNCYYSKFQNFNKSLTTKEIWNSYKTGFGASTGLSDYSIKVGFSTD